MELIKIESRNISRVGYKTEKHVMRVVFSNGSTYEYANVPEEIYRMFLGSPSKGMFFKDQIKYRYNYTKVC